MRYIPISVFGTLDFCEYQIYLQYVMGIKAKPTEAMLRGRERHETLESEFLEEAEPIEEPIEDHIAKMVRGEVAPFSLREFYVKSDSLSLHGVIDEISLYPETAIIVDDKPGTTVRTGHVDQLNAYALSFRENYAWKGKIYVALRNRDSASFFWQSLFGAEEEASIVGKTERLQRLLAGDETFTACGNPKKCACCRFATLCPEAAP